MIEMMSTQRDGVTVLTVGGELDIATVRDLRVPLREAVRDGSGRVEVHLDSLTFCDASGVRLLVDAAAEARRSGCDFVVCNPRAPVRRIFDLARLDGALAITSNGNGSS
jgi:anti-sigma B factor antagonist